MKNIKKIVELAQEITEMRLDIASDIDLLSKIELFEDYLENLTSEERNVLNLHKMANKEIYLM